MAILSCCAGFALRPGYCRRLDQEHCLCNINYSDRMPAGLSGQAQSAGCGARYNRGGGKSDFSRNCGRLTLYRAFLHAVAMIERERVVVVRDLLVKYGDRTILDRINLDIRQGEILVLLGGS